MTMFENRSRRVVGMLAAALLLLSLSSCDISEVGESHYVDWGTPQPGCVAFVQHWFINSSSFRAQTSEKNGSNCAGGVAAWLTVRGFNGVVYDTSPKWDNSYAADLEPAVASPWSHHILCRDTTHCAGGNY
ncbi:MAG TPA: hypothetical protein VFU19_19530 [Iamia sp.]|nr:hypothetical protein [Iamia sp.]